MDTPYAYVKEGGPAAVRTESGPDRTRGINPARPLRSTTRGTRSRLDRLDQAAVQILAGGCRTGEMSRAFGVRVTRAAATESTHESEAASETPHRDPLSHRSAGTAFRTLGFRSRNAARVEDILLPTGLREPNGVGGTSGASGPSSARTRSDSGDEERRVANEGPDPGIG
jgi:hypothetical protein